MIRPGRLNTITDVAGIRVGSADDVDGRTGVSVVLPERRMLAAVDVRGGGPGTRDTDALDPTCLVDAVDAVVLAGGSVYGLETASAVTTWLGAQGRGYELGGTVAPIVPAAILFDLANGGVKDWGMDPPYRRLGLAAVAAAGEIVRLGTAGAGYGAKAGRLKGGLGSASAMDECTGITLGALVAANPAGSVVMPGSDCFWAWALEQDGEMGGQPTPLGPVSLEPAASLEQAAPGTSTTIGVVALDATLSRAEARRVAMMAQDGLARAIRPAHTPFDGDTLFVLATAAVTLPEPRPRTLARLGAIAADCVARAIARGVFLATALGDTASGATAPGNWPSYRERHGRALRGTAARGS